MPTRNGKIANLPNDIREQLNLRLLEGETGRELAAWLNALPEVQSVLASQFNGSPVSEVNLTHWRQGGYLQWLMEREFFDSARALADGDRHLTGASLSAERLLSILTLRFGQLLLYWDTEIAEGDSQSSAFSVTARKARILQGMSRSILAIHRIQSQRSFLKRLSNRRLHRWRTTNWPKKKDGDRTNSHAGSLSPRVLAPRAIVQVRIRLGHGGSRTLPHARSHRDESEDPLRPDRSFQRPSKALSNPRRMRRRRMMATLIYLNRA